VIFSRPIRLSLIVLCGIILPHTGVSAELFEPHACSVSSDLVADVSGQVDQRIGGLTASEITKGIFVTRGDETSPWATSSSVWTALGDPVDWSGASPWNSNGGYNFAGTLVTPRHLLFANHYQIGIGATVLFVAPDNSVVTRTLSAAQSISGTDITVGMLDSDVPASITYYPILSASKLESYVRDGVDESLFDLPIIAFDQEDHAIIRATQKSILYKDTRVVHFSIASGARAGFSETLVSGDSGNPLFLLVGNKPVLLTSHYYDTYGPNYSHYRNEIEAAIDSLGGGYDLSDLDLGCFNAPIVLDENQSLVIRTESLSDGVDVGTIGIKHNVEGEAPYFTISAGNTDGLLAISSSTGSVTLASSSIALSVSNLPRSIVVRVEEGGDGGRASEALVSVSLSPRPFFPPASYEYSIDENSPVDGSVGRVLATDYDDDSLSYSILSGNDLGAFRINSVTGMLLVASSTPLDYETRQSFSLVVQAVEVSTVDHLVATTSVSVTLNDLSTSFDELSYSFNLRDDAAVGTFVGRVVSTVADDDYEPYYEIVSGNDDGVFSVNSSTGIITVTDDSSLSYDLRRSHPLVISVSEGDGLSAVATVLASVSIQKFVPVVVPVVPTVIRSSRSGGGGGGSRSVVSQAASAVTLPVVTGALVPSQDLSLSSFIQLLIALQVISPDKVAFAQSFLQAQGSAVVASAPAGQVLRPLSFGMSGDDVASVQRSLNLRGFSVASSGPGSTGNESRYFGSATESALRRFQCDVLSVCSGTPVTTGYGAVGPRTRAALGL